MDTKGLQTFWPSIIDEQSARKAVINGFYIIVFSVGITAISIAIKYFNEQYRIENVLGSLIGDILPLSIAGYFMYKKMSRTGCIVALSLMIIELLYDISFGKGIGIRPILILFLIGATRGAFAYHNLYKNANVTKETANK